MSLSIDQLKFGVYKDVANNFNVGGKASILVYEKRLTWYPQNIR